MTPKVVTFDCAFTLVDVKWTPSRSVRECAARLGLEMPDEAFSAYGRLFVEWRPEYERVNLSRDPAALRDFWWRLNETWLAQCGHSRDLTEAFVLAAEELAYGPEQSWFRPYDDVIPCLDRLAVLGVRTAVLSNWDISLHRILSQLDLYHRFELVVASLEEGPEKPDPALFQLALDRLGVGAEEVLHVGDTVEDDVEGARRAGFRALLIDRTGAASAEGAITSLDQLPEAFAWSA